MCDTASAHHYAAADIRRVVELVFAGRVVFHDGKGEVMPGIAVHLVPGHTQGLQVVCIETSEGPVVLASDALHFYASLREGKPFTVATDPMQKLQGYAEVQKLAGHDPEVMCFYPDRAGHPDIARIFGKSAVVLAEAEPRKFPVTKGLTP